MPGSESLIKAFAMIHYHQVTGIAIVNRSDGKIVGNISASDLKGFMKDKRWYEKLQTPVDELLQDAFYRVCIFYKIIIIL